MEHHPHLSYLLFVNSVCWIKYSCQIVSDSISLLMQVKAHQYRQCQLKCDRFVFECLWSVHSQFSNCTADNAITLDLLLKRKTWPLLRCVFVNRQSASYLPANCPFPITTTRVISWYVRYKIIFYRSKALASCNQILLQTCFYYCSFICITHFWKDPKRIELVAGKMKVVDWATVRFGHLGGGTFTRTLWVWWRKNFQKPMLFLLLSSCIL